MNVNDLRQWQYDSRVQSGVRRLAGDAADEIERLRAALTAIATDDAVPAFVRTVANGALGAYEQKTTPGNVK